MWWVFCPCLTGMPNNRIPNDGGNCTEYPTSGITNDGIPNNGMSSNHTRYNMQWVFRPCLTGIPNDGMPVNDGMPNDGMSSII